MRIVHIIIVAIGKITLSTLSPMSLYSLIKHANNLHWHGQVHNHITSTCRHYIHNDENRNQWRQRRRWHTLSPLSPLLLIATVTTINIFENNTLAKD